MHELQQLLARLGEIVAGDPTHLVSFDPVKKSFIFATGGDEAEAWNKIIQAVSNRDHVVISRTETALLSVLQKDKAEGK